MSIGLGELPPNGPNAIASFVLCRILKHAVPDLQDKTKRAPDLRHRLYIFTLAADFS